MGTILIPWPEAGWSLNGCTTMALNRMIFKWVQHYSLKPDGLKWVHHNGLNPFSTGVPFWGQTSQIPSGLSPKRACGSKRVKPDGLQLNGYTTMGTPLWP